MGQQKPAGAAARTMPTAAILTICMCLRSIDRPSLLHASMTAAGSAGESNEYVLLPLFRACHGHVNKKQPLLSESGGFFYVRPAPAAARRGDDPLRRQFMKTAASTSATPPPDRRGDGTDAPALHELPRHRLTEDEDARGGCRRDQALRMRHPC
jgi:hypothetical protein